MSLLWDDQPTEVFPQGHRGGFYRAHRGDTVLISYSDPECPPTEDSPVVTDLAVRLTRTDWWGRLGQPAVAAGVAVAGASALDDMLEVPLPLDAAERLADVLGTLCAMVRAEQLVRAEGPGVAR